MGCRQKISGQKLKACVASSQTNIWYKIAISFPNILCRLSWLIPTARIYSVSTGCRLRQLPHMLLELLEQKLRLDSRAEQAIFFLTDLPDISYLFWYRHIHIDQHKTQKSHQHNKHQVYPSRIDELYSALRGFIHELRLPASRKICRPDCLSPMDVLDHTSLRADTTKSDIYSFRLETARNILSLSRKRNRSPGPRSFKWNAETRNPVYPFYNPRCSNYQKQEVADERWQHSTI